MKTPNNHLLTRLPVSDRRLLTSQCTPTSLVLNDVLCETAAPTRYVYFPLEGFISLVAQLDGKPAVEVGMVGREGMLGSQLALGVTSVPWHALVQGAGTALRMSATTFVEALAQSETLRRVMHRYIYVLMLQQTTSAAAAMLRSGLIEYHRGALTVLNRQGLVDAACSCYSADQHAYHKQLGKLKP